MSATNNLTNSIIELLTFKGHYVYRVNVQGTYDPVRQIRRKMKKESRGIADIVGLLSSGIHIEVEVKADDDKLSQEQKEHGLKVLEKGGIYLVAHSLASMDVIQHEVEGYVGNLKVLIAKLKVRLEAELVKKEKPKSLKLPNGSRIKFGTRPLKGGVRGR